jgi:sulfite reductase beta subunit-like hemoprotein
MSKKIKTDYYSLFLHIQEYISGTIEYSELKHTAASFGIYKQRDNKFMARIRITGGEISKDKLSAILQISEKYSIGFLHLTSRQDIQMHDVDIKNIIPIVTECTEKGMPFRGGGGDTFRNVAVCHHSGFSKESVFDVLPYAKQLTSRISNYDKAFDDLPRKIKIGFSCCDKDIALAKLQDLGFIAKAQNGIEGFVVYGGGGMGNQSSVGVKLIDFLPAGNAIQCAIAMTDLFYDHGDRTSRSKARIRFILKKMGETKFRNLFLKYYNNLKDCKRGIPPLDKTINFMSNHKSDSECKRAVSSKISLLPFNEWESRAVSNTEFDNTALVKLFVPYGNLQIADLKKIIEIMSETKSCFVRLSRGENIYIPVGNSDLQYVFRQLNDYKQTADFTANSLKGLITSCIGAKTCAIGIVDSHKFSDSITKELNLFFCQNPDNKTNFFKNIINTIKISGCPNSCSNHPAFSLGFQGIRRKNKEGLPTDYCKLFIGGKPDKLNECVDGLLLDSEQIGKYVLDLVQKYYKTKKENRELSFNSFLSTN